MSICGECQRKIGTCSWNKEFKPVPGWKATPTKILVQTAWGKRTNQSYMDSFNVIECPLYIPPEKGRGRPTEYRKSAAIVAEDAITHKKTRYSSVRKACEAGGFVDQRVRECLEGHKQSHHGYLFYYEGKEDGDVSG